MKKWLTSFPFIIALGVVASGWISPRSRHIELTDSFPKADAVVDSVPVIQLWFNVPPELEQSGVGLRGPDGTMRLGKIERGDDSVAFKATVLSELSEGRYTVSWLAAPYEDHGVRGRFRFTVGAGGTQLLSR